MVGKEARDKWSTVEARLFCSKRDSVKSEVVWVLLQIIYTLMVEEETAKSRLEEVRSSEGSELDDPGSSPRGH